MGKIAGFGGVFLKSADPQALAAWYRDKLGVPFGDQLYADMPFSTTTAGSNVLSFVRQESEYFEPSGSNVMLNLRVEGMEEYLAEIRGRGVELIGEPMSESYGKFAWVLDLDGNKVELWEAV